MFNLVHMLHLQCSTTPEPDLVFKILVKQVTNSEVHHWMILGDRKTFSMNKHLFNDNLRFVTLFLHILYSLSFVSYKWHKLQSRPLVLDPLYEASFAGSSIRINHTRWVHIYYNYHFTRFFYYNSQFKLEGIIFKLERRGSVISVVVSVCVV